jgi:hypothetical protein
MRRRLLFSTALVPTQLRLGLGSSGDVGLLAFHIPVGDLIFFLTNVTVALSLGLPLVSR